MSLLSPCCSSPRRSISRPGCRGRGKKAAAGARRARLDQQHRQGEKLAFEGIEGQTECFERECPEQLVIAGLAEDHVCDADTVLVPKHGAAFLALNLRAVREPELLD